MGTPLSLPKIDTEIDTVGQGGQSNHTTTKDSIVTQISVAGDSIILVLLIIAFIISFILWYLHRTNFHLLHTRLSNLASAVGIGQEQTENPVQLNNITVAK